MGKQRSGHTKVRTGCYTCKLRRLKCGEEKPFCRRCVILGVDCAGYPVLVKTTAPELRQLIPKAARPSVSQIALQVKRNPHPGIIMTEVENRYFAVFYNDLAKGFGGAYYSSIWQRLIPQMGEVEPFIRHATVALGALTKSSVPMIQNQKPLRGSPLQDPHHMFAMKAYCKALKGIRESMSQNRGDIRSALLASLLAFCFESMQGHETAAFSHAVGGVTLFQNWQKEHSNSNVMEVDDLAFTFAGLDLQALLLNDTRPQVVHEEHVKALNHAIAKMPAEFQNLKDCHSYMQLIMRRSLHFIILARLMKHTHDASQETLNELPDTSSSYSGNYPWCDADHSSNEPMSKLSTEQASHMIDLSKWREACGRIFESTGLAPLKLATARQIEDFILTNTLKIQSVSFEVPPFSTTDKIITNAHLSNFRAIVELSAQTMPLLVKSEKLHFHMGILPSLTLVVTYCRNRELRFKALGLLLQCPEYQEGIFNSWTVGKPAQAQVNLEEPWRNENGDIPENRWVVMLDKEIFLEKRTMTVTFSQRIGTDNVNEVEVTKHLLTW